MPADVNLILPLINLQVLAPPPINQIEWVREVNIRGGEFVLERKNFKRCFQVKTLYDRTFMDAVLKARDPNTNLAIPNLGEFYQVQHPAGFGYEYNLFSFAANKRARPCSEPDNHRLWYVEVDYSSDFRGIGWYDYEWTTQEVKLPFIKEFRPGVVEDAQAWVLNKAGEAFDPPPVRESFVKVLRHTRVEATFNHESIDAYLNRYNLLPFPGVNGYAAGMVLMKKFSAKARWLADNTAVYDVLREFWFAQKGESAVSWEPRRFLNAGYSAKAAAPPGKRYEILDATGKKPSKPRLLQPDGTYDPDKQAPNPPGDNANYCKFYSRHGADFNDFNLIF